LEEKFYTLQQVADMLQMHIETVRELVRNKELIAYKINRRDYRVSKADLEEFLRKRRTTDTTDENP
jgi:excisionase family DNA binding protein